MSERNSEHSLKVDTMETIYECILGSTTHFAQTQQEAMDWLEANPTGKYKNNLHGFVINGGVKNVRNTCPKSNNLR